MAASHSKSMERLIRTRSSAGLCIACGKPKEAGEKRLKCNACRLKQNAEVKKIYDARAAVGICIQCGKQPAMAGKRNCEKCRDYHISYMQSRYRIMASQHCCTACGAKMPSDYFYSRCQKCRDKQNERHRILHPQKKADVVAADGK